MSFDLNTAFGQLRALLNEPFWNGPLREAFWTLVERAHRTNPEGYSDQWLPYIQSFPHHLQQSPKILTTVEELEDAASMLPHASWGFAPADVEQLYMLQSSTHASSVVDLRVRGLELIGADLYNILETPGFKQLTSLDLSHNSIGDEDMLAFKEFPLLSLNTLKLDGLTLEHEGLTMLANVPGLSALKSLSLCCFGVEALALKCVFNSPHFTLEQLFLINDDEDLVVEVADAPKSAFLKSLTLHGGSMGPEGVQTLVSSPHLTGLEFIDLCENAIEDEGVQLLMASPSMRQLKHLLLEDNDMGVEGVEAIASSTQMASMHTLDLTFNRFGDEGVEALLAGSIPESLRTLCLEFCDLTDVSAHAFADDPRLKHLLTMDIAEGNDELGSEGCAALHHSKHLHDTLRDMFASFE